MICLPYRILCGVGRSSSPSECYSAYKHKKPVELPHWSGINSLCGWNRNLPSGKAGRWLGTVGTYRAGLRTPMPLPSEILRAVAHPDGGQIVLVLGAGCSREPPTNLPIGAECSRDAHRNLVDDNILSDGQCPNPEDLSILAETVHQITGSQTCLVERLPRNRFRLADPNDGHLLAAAMLSEGTVTAVLTLNHDLAMSSALTRVGAISGVGIVDGPRGLASLAASNLIYLHRNVDADPEEWILRTSALEAEWRDTWQEVIATRVLLSPITVFAGLGSPARVLLETVRRLREVCGDTIEVYQVDPVDKANSAFFRELGIPESRYLRMGWCEFMREIADRLAKVHCTEIETACERLTRDGGWGREDIAGLCDRIRQRGLLGLGKIRARWLLDESSYVPKDAVDPGWLADLLLAIGLIERVTGSRADIGTEGLAVFWRGHRAVGAVVLAHGRGIQRWFMLERTIRSRRRMWQHSLPRPTCALVAGVPEGRPREVSPPEDLLSVQDPASIVSPDRTVKMYSVDELRSDPSLIGSIMDA